MRSLLCCLLLLTTASQAAAPAQQVSDGTPYITAIRILHIRKVSLMSRLIEINYHLMGCSLVKNGCSVGSQLSFWMQTGTQEENCYQWFSEVLAMEASNQSAKPYPYLEVVTEPGQVLTDEGLWVYPVGTVSCNGALDWTNP